MPYTKLYRRSINRLQTSRFTEVTTSKYIHVIPTLDYDDTSKNMNRVGIRIYGDKHEYTLVIPPEDIPDLIKNLQDTYDRIVTMTLKLYVPTSRFDETVILELTASQRKDFFNNLLIILEPSQRFTIRLNGETHEVSKIRLSKDNIAACQVLIYATGHFNTGHMALATLDGYYLQGRI